MPAITYNDPRLISSAALAANPFTPDDYLDVDGAPHVLGDKIYVLSHIDKHGNGWRVSVNDNMPTTVFNQKLQAVIQHATGQTMPIIGPMKYRPLEGPLSHLSPVAGDTLSFLNDRLLVLRRDHDMPATSMPGHLMNGGGYWGGGPLGKLADTEQKEEVRVVKVEKLDANRHANIILYDFRLAGTEVADRGVSEQELSILADNLKKWHGIERVEISEIRSLDLIPRHDPAVPVSPVNVFINGQQTESFEVWAGPQRWRGHNGLEFFDGQMNTFCTVRLYGASLDGVMPEFVPPLTNNPVPAEEGQILVVDGEKYGRAGGAVRPGDISSDDKILPTLQQYLFPLKVGPA